VRACARVRVCVRACVCGGAWVLCARLRAFVWSVASVGLAPFCLQLGPWLRTSLGQSSLWHGVQKQKYAPWPVYQRRRSPSKRPQISIIRGLILESRVPQRQ